ncbi:MAG TPA: hypothetical protein HA257_04675 [Candidatus Methanoperedenaceae archaeon]|nr:hypothetical protein [Candidatus Methanoperedenaceae archaeon]
MRRIYVTLLAAALVIISGCISEERLKTPAQYPTADLFILYPSDTNYQAIASPVYHRGDVAYFTLRYNTSGNYKPVHVSDIEPGFTEIKPTEKDVRYGLHVKDLAFTGTGGAVLDNVTLNPGNSTMIRLTMPQNGNLTAILGNSTSESFNLIIKIRSLPVPLKSSTFVLEVP